MHTRKSIVCFKNYVPNFNFCELDIELALFLDKYL